MDKLFWLQQWKQYDNMEMLKRIRRILGEKIIVEPIVDYARYMPSEDSYSGNSLSESNMLIVTNVDIPRSLVNGIENKEGICVSIIKPDVILTTDQIKKAGSKLIGPYTHIVNIYTKDKSLDLLDTDGSYPEDDEMYRLYQWLQEETSYLVPMNQYATICTVFIDDKTTYSSVLSKNVDMCIRGLGEVLGNHSIISNGIVASKEIPLDIIINTTLFLSSKYGQIMAGEVLKLK